VLDATVFNLDEDFAVHATESVVELSTRRTLATASVRLTPNGAASTTSIQYPQRTTACRRSPKAALRLAALENAPGAIRRTSAFGRQRFLDTQQHLETLQLFPAAAPFPTTLARFFPRGPVSAMCQMTIPGAPANGQFRPFLSSKSLEAFVSKPASWFYAGVNQSRRLTWRHSSPRQRAIARAMRCQQTYP
jgi:hypothetical protein